MEVIQISSLCPEPPENNQSLLFHEEKWIYWPVLDAGIEEWIIFGAAMGSHVQFFSFRCSLLSDSSEWFHFTVTLHLS